MKPQVTVIVPTKNSERTLGQCLESIKNQTYKNIEIILVDNESLDKTRDIVWQYTDQIFIKGSERNAQRNYGAKRAKGEYLLFIDSDMILEKKVVEECVDKIKNDHSIAIVIPQISFGQGFWSKCKALEISSYVGDDLMEAPRFFDKQRFFESGMYREDMIAMEDFDLKNRIRKLGKISRIESFVKHNEGKLTLIKAIKKKYFYGKTIEKYIKRNKEEAKLQIRFIRLSFIKNKKNFIKHPLLTLGFIFMRGCECVGASFGFIVSKMRGV